MSVKSIGTMGAVLAGSLVAGVPFMVIGGGHTGHQAKKTDSATALAWGAWTAGDLGTARSLAEKLTGTPATSDAGHQILALVASVEGDYAAAIAHRHEISPGFPRLSGLDEPVLCSYVHAGDLTGALAFAEQRHLPKVTLKRLELAISKPLSVQLHGVSVMPFTNDALTPFMPGMDASFCGRETVVRLDTGGSYVHISDVQAADYGIKPVAFERAFSSLTTGKVGHAVAPELRIGQAVLLNVPVAIHYRTLQPEQIARAFGVDLGPIIGTNVLEQFLTTVDGPGRRLILSPRGGAEARAQHLATVGPPAEKASVVPFARWLDHLMLVQGRIAGRPGRFLVDTGLVAATPGQGQANLLASRQKIAEWGTAAAQGQTFPVVPGTLRIGDASRDRPTVYPVDNKVWRAFGDWGGSRVDALVSWGFLSHFVWTLDFDRHCYVLADPQRTTDV